MVGISTVVVGGCEAVVGRDVSVNMGVMGGGEGVTLGMVGEGWVSVSWAGAFWATISCSRSRLSGIVTVRGGLARAQPRASVIRMRVGPIFARNLKK